MTLNSVGNNYDFDVDKDGNIYSAFKYQNRIEKFSKEGRKFWQVSRELGYSTKLNLQNPLIRIFFSLNCITSMTFGVTKTKSISLMRTATLNFLNTESSKNNLANS